MTRRRINLGRTGESLARDYLTGLGWVFEGANVRTSYGEIDLLFRDGETLVAVEVKSRVVYAPEVVTVRQLGRIARSLEFLAAKTGHAGPLRVDLVTVHRDRCRLVRDVGSALA